MILPSEITVTAHRHGNPDVHHYLVGPSKWQGAVAVRTLTHRGEVVAPRFPPHHIIVTAFCAHTMTQFIPEQ